MPQRPAEAPRSRNSGYIYSATAAGIVSIITIIIKQRVYLLVCWCSSSSSNSISAASDVTVTPLPVSPTSAGG
jgi:hypothetical protein